MDYLWCVSFIQKTFTECHLCPDTECEFGAVKGKGFQVDKDELDAQQGGNLNAMTAMKITYIGDFHKLFPSGDLMSASWKRWHLGRALIGRIGLWTQTR